MNNLPEIGSFMSDDFRIKKEDFGNAFLRFR